MSTLCAEWRVGAAGRVHGRGTAAEVYACVRRARVRLRHMASATRPCASVSASMAMAGAASAGSELKSSVDGVASMSSSLSPFLAPFLLAFLAPLVLRGVDLGVPLGVGLARPGDGRRVEVFGLSMVRIQLMRELPRLLEIP